MRFICYGDAQMVTRLVAGVYYYTVHDSAGKRIASGQLQVK
ncbi:MAG: hypothetical protein RMJ33_14020 [Saprospiraceae bacterium]|nr:hypothetical protein [Saprospiraceae bacterium]MDW8230946.1 hypothetical protein [Saprospiraceae bacterium]